MAIRVLRAAHDASDLDLATQYGLAVDPDGWHTHERATNREAVKDNESTSKLLVVV